MNVKVHPFPVTEDNRFSKNSQSGEWLLGTKMPLLLLLLEILGRITGNRKCAPVDAKTKQRSLEEKLLVISTKVLQTSRIIAEQERKESRRSRRIFIIYHHHDLGEKSVILANLPP